MPPQDGGRNERTEGLGRTGGVLRPETFGLTPEQLREQDATEQRGMGKLPGHHEHHREATLDCIACGKA